MYVTKGNGGLIRTVVGDTVRCVWGGGGHSRQCVAFELACYPGSHGCSLAWVFVEELRSSN